MRKEKKIGGNDVSNFLVSVMVACFSILIGGSWFLGLLLEPEKSEDSLIWTSLGLFLGGIGCSIYCFYLLTKKNYQWLYYTGLALVIVGYGLAIFGQAIYNNI